MHDPVAHRPTPHARHRKLARALLLLAGVALCGLSARASATNLRYAPPRTVYVKLEFDGDPGFPNLTVMHQTPGLMPFTGSAFGLTTAQRNDVVNQIISLLRQDYQGTNVEFVTNTAGIASFYTWGIDDLAFIFLTGTCDNPGRSFSRLFGKAGNGFGTDCTGSSIHFPRHARTFAGSFTSISFQSPSQPSLHLGNLLPDGTPVTTAHIAQALANSAAHEIGHLFGLVHPSCLPGSACVTDRIMFTAEEAIEATHNKSFDGGEQATLRAALGDRALLHAGINGTVLDDGTGLVMSSDLNLPGHVQVGAIGGGGVSTLTFADGQQYAAGLDYLGYDDWRLPDAVNPDGSGPCSFKLGGLVILRSCNASELGRFRFEFLNTPAAGLLSNLDSYGPYWSTPASGPWIYRLSTGEQYPTATLPGAHVWPVRGTFALVDNGDGTVIDYARRLMWVKNPGSLPRMNRFDAGQFLIGRTISGWTGWRLPRLGDRNDFTCDNTDHFSVPTGGPSGGCTRSELAQLYQRWGVRVGADSPLVVPADGGPFWFEDELVHPGEPWADQPFAFSFAGGVQATTGVNDVAGLWPVRDLEPGFVRAGDNVVVDVHPNVVVRFQHVRVPGFTSVTVKTAALPPPVYAGNPKTYSFESTTLYQGTPDAVTVCLRYTPDELPQIAGSGTVAILQTVNGTSPTILPTAPGYPDLTNRTICARAPYLTEFKVVVQSTSIVPRPVFP